ncbi:hypothetical protein D9756_001252 [Leucocoprinus leucothites]|uniref:Uncharacterized protein n=1 Tax=Leucocoprinus leucothites TaxID=201217 RepID=A0A8H5G4K5_9AGAR|nr:hypothetical protein D9756_001252 [Leucoagaricus leucothites]
MTRSLTKDVAAVLENIEASPTYIPALYTTFLCVLISAQLEPQQGSQAGEPKQDEGDPTYVLPSTLGIYESPSTNTASPPVLKPAQALNSNHTSPNPNPTGSKGIPSPSAATAPTTTTTGISGKCSIDDDDSEMGPVVGMSTFQPTSPNRTDGGAMVGGLTMENILSGFWDSMLVPGGGFVFGDGGSGLITPRFGLSPMQSGTNAPSRGHAQHPLTQYDKRVFNHHGQLKDGI